MDIKDMTTEQIEERVSSIKNELSNPEIEEARLAELRAELEAIEARKNEVKQLNEVRNQVAEATNLPVIEKVPQEERKMIDVKEYRNSAEYVNAYADMIKTGKEEECRSLLTTNVGEGTIAVPDFVLDIVKTAWDKEELLANVTKTSVKGNLKVQFEISGDDAIVHTEGSGAISEENLTLGIVTIVPASIKKVIGISDEAMDLRGEAFLRYIYAELTAKIAKKIADQLVSMVVALPTTATATSVAAEKISVAPSMSAVAEAIGNLSDEANAPIIVMNKLTWSAFKGVQYANNYGVDPFEGLKVVFNNTLPAYSAASTGAVYMVIGDFKQGAIANFPNGEGIDFKFDDMTRKKEDIVEVLGREYVGLGLVANKSFVNVAKPATNG